MDIAWEKMCGIYGIHGEDDSDSQRYISILHYIIYNVRQVRERERKSLMHYGFNITCIAV